MLVGNFRHNYGLRPMLGGAVHANPMLPLLQMMMQLLDSMMQMSGGFGGGHHGCPNGGGYMSPAFSPNFGGNTLAPGHRQCRGGGHFSTSQGVPGFNHFGGCSRHSKTQGSGYRSTDAYVPSGQDAFGPVGNLGAGQGANAVRWALSKEGISEKNNPSAIRAISRGKWQPWCADFVSQAYKNSGGSPFGHQSSVWGILKWGQKQGRFIPANSARRSPGMLRVGDIATWKSKGKSHVGLVVGVNKNGTFRTIEGNTGDACRQRTHSFGAGLTGFVRPRGSMPV